MPDFSLPTYKKLCQVLLDQGYQFNTFDDFYRNKSYAKKGKTVVMRHDVDRLPYNSLQMSRVEHELGISSTYYFRHIPSVFKQDIIKAIYDLKHEIGYHYETLSKAAGDKELAISLFVNELNDFRKIVPITTICMHGSPLSSYDNRELWQYYDYKKYGIIAEPYLSIDYEKVAYFTDTGRTWGETSLNLRDRVEVKTPFLNNLTDTNSLINYIKKNEPKTLIIQTHPERWAYSINSYIFSYCMDTAANTIKMMIKLVRK